MDKDLEITIPDPSALSGSALEEKAVSVAVGKTKLSIGKCLVSAILAGTFIGFGGMFFGLILGDPSIPFAAQRVIGGLSFCLGLVLVLCCGAELFTGNMLMICAKLEKRISLSDLLKNWALVWLGNLGGALLAVAIICLSGMQSMNQGMVGDAFVNLAASKASLDPINLFFKAIMCNILVCLAVWIGFASKTIVDKVIGILLPISAFVACGFEHCVANMTFLPMGLVLNTLGFGEAGAISLGGICYNLALATLGNIVGGVLVGIAYWYINKR